MCFLSFGSGFVISVNELSIYSWVEIGTVREKCLRPELGPLETSLRAGSRLSVSGEVARTSYHDGDGNGNENVTKE